MIDIVYPYIEAEWEELRYSLRSLDMYFKEDYKVHVVGDYCPEWITNVNYVYMPKQDKREADVGQKYKWMCENFDNFVLMNDDFFLLKPTTLKDVRKVRYKGVQVLKEMPETPWEHMIQASVLALGVEPVYNFVTHTPRYFESKKLVDLDKKYHIFDGETLGVLVYFNEFISRKVKRSLSSKIDWLSLGNISNTRPVSEHQFFNCNEAALDDSLKAYIKARFPTPGRFEKESKVVSIPAHSSLLLYTGKKKTFHWDDIEFKHGIANTTPERAKYLANKHPEIFQLG